MWHLSSVILVIFACWSSKGVQHRRLGRFGEEVWFEWAFWVEDWSWSDEMNVIVDDLVCLVVCEITSSIWTQCLHQHYFMYISYNWFTIFVFYFLFFSVTIRHWNYPRFCDFLARCCNCEMLGNCLKMLISAFFPLGNSNACTIFRLIFQHLFHGMRWYKAKWCFNLCY